ncbi:hypothetical protein BGZ68_003802, partial [Mortierella alpina]
MLTAVFSRMTPTKTAMFGQPMRRQQIMPLRRKNGLASRSGPLARGTNSQTRKARDGQRDPVPGKPRRFR